MPLTICHERIARVLCSPREATAPITSVSEHRTRMAHR